MISPGDVQPGDARLTGRRRIDWLLAHGSRSVWAFLDALDELMLVVFSPGADPRHHAAPERTELPVPRADGGLTVALDLGQLARDRKEVASAPERW